jgi:hypothetical protein
MSSSKYNNMMNLNSDVIKDLIDISKEIENEQENNEPDSEKITKLLYKQLIRGMELNTGYGRNYYKPY